VSSDLEARLRRLEDRVQISEQVTKYALGVDRRDWRMFAECFTDPVHTNMADAGTPSGELSRAELVERISTVLDEFTATQHISPNHVIEFDDEDPDRAVCHSYMYAQHLLHGAPGGEFYLLRGSYTNHMVRTPGGWRIERIIQHRGWSDGNDQLVAEAVSRAAGKPQP
jgi:hypothetical protein